MIPETSLGNLESEVKLLRRMLESQLSSLAWQHEKYARPLDALLVEKLMEHGFPKAFAKEQLNKLDEVKAVDSGIEIIKANLTSQLPEAETDILKKGGIVALVGPTGVGKTTTLAKLATKFVFLHGNADIAIINADSYRIAAKDQVSIYANILDVPMYNVSSKDELNTALSKLKNKKLILIDTSGVILETNEILKRLSCLEGQRIKHCYLTLAASGAYDTLSRTVDLFSFLPLTGCILTKLDETSKTGTILSLLIENQLPVSYLSHGQRVPEDIQVARSCSLINTAFNNLSFIRSYSQLDNSKLEEAAAC